MARTYIHLDAMLRHLGAAYYESLHGRATHADVTRALDTVEEHLAQQGTTGPAGKRRRTSPQGPFLILHYFLLKGSSTSGAGSTAGRSCATRNSRLSSAADQ